MSYDVSGGGEFVLRKDDKVPDEVLALLRSAEFLVEDAPDGGIWLTFEYTNFNDQIEDALKAFAPYVESGDVEFRDDFGDHFRYRLANGKVWYANGEITYLKERLITESKMKLYRTALIETKAVEYTVRATSEGEANEMFTEWYEHHTDVVDRELANTDGDRRFATVNEIVDGDPDSADILDCQHEEVE